MPAEAERCDARSADFDVVVVGGGVIGLACAWRAGAARGAGRRCSSAAEPAAGATRVAAGMLAPVGELTFGEEELLELTLAAARLLPGVRRRAGGGERDRARATSGSARCTSRSTATRRRSCGGVHDLQRSLELEAEWLPPRALPRPRAGPDARRSTAASSRRARRRSIRGR